MCDHTLAPVSLLPSLELCQKPVPTDCESKPMSKNYTVQWVALESQTHNHSNANWWCNACLEQCRKTEYSKDFTAEWLEALWAWTLQFAQMTWALTVALAVGLFGLFVSVLWILHCFFEGVDNDSRIHQANLKARDGLDMEERDQLQGEHKSLLAKRERLLVHIDQIKDARAFPNSDGKWGIKAGLVDLEEAVSQLSDCEAKLGQTEAKLSYHMHG